MFDGVFGNTVKISVSANILGILCEHTLRDLEDKGCFNIHTYCFPDVNYTVSSVIAQVIVSYTIYFRIYNFIYLDTEGDEFCGIYHTFKNGVLNANAVVVADFGYFPQTFSAFRRFSIYIICYEN